MEKRHPHLQASFKKQNHDSIRMEDDLFQQEIDLSQYITRRDQIQVKLQLEKRKIDNKFKKLKSIQDRERLSDLLVK